MMSCSLKQPDFHVGGRQLKSETVTPVSKDDSLTAMEKFAAQAAAREQEKADKEALVPLLNETSFDRRRVVAVYKDDGTRGHHMSVSPLAVFLLASRVQSQILEIKSKVLPMVSAQDPQSQSTLLYNVFHMCSCITWSIKCSQVMFLENTHGQVTCLLLDLDENLVACSCKKQRCAE